jgi:sulfatase modifying factor 1
MKACQLRIAWMILSALLAAGAARAGLVNLETVAVGDPGNTGDTTGFGAVAYEYRIGKYEVTINQYATFLNSVAQADPFSLYSGFMNTDANIAGILRVGSSPTYSYSVIGDGERPIGAVSWFDAARFANWLHNGGTNGASTETGAYTLNGASRGLFFRNPDAKWWIPTESEWYKAAYYKGGGTNSGYWLYPTQSDAPPGNDIGGGPNNANYYAGGYYPNGAYTTTQSPEYSNSVNYLTAIGAFSGSASFYGTFDQGGNLSEWNDSVYYGSMRGLRGGYWGTAFEGDLSATWGGATGPDGLGGFGFRLAGAVPITEVPEASTWLVAAFLACCAALVRRKHGRDRAP